MSTLLLLIMLASPESDLATARTAYEAYRYDQAISQLDKLLGAAPKNAQTRQDAQALLAFAHYLKRDQEKARIAVRLLLQENVDYKVDREALHPALVQFYDDERNAYIASLKTQPALVPQLKLEPAPTLGDRQPWLRAVPLGVGQFANEDYVTGGVFLGLEVALIALNVAGSVWRYSSLDSTTNTYRSGARKAQVLQNVAAISAIVTAVVGIVDAFVWSPTRHHSDNSSSDGPRDIKRE